MNSTVTYVNKFAHALKSSIISDRRLLSSIPAFALVFGATAAVAATAGPNMPWETPLQTVADSITGPVAKAIGVIAIATTGLGFAFSEGGSVVRRGLGIVFGLAIAFTASTFLTSFFTLTTGALVP